MCSPSVENKRYDMHSFPVLVVLHACISYGIFYTRHPRYTRYPQQAHLNYPTLSHPCCCCVRTSSICKTSAWYRVSGLLLCPHPYQYRTWNFFPSYPFPRSPPPSPPPFPKPPLPCLGLARLFVSSSLLLAAPGNASMENHETENRCGTDRIAHFGYLRSNGGYALMVNPNISVPNDKTILQMRKTSWKPHRNNGTNRK